MPTVRLDEGLSLHCAVDDYLWPWEAPTPVLMMHGFARNATFWNRWVPTIAESRRICRPDLLGCGASDIPAHRLPFHPREDRSRDPRGVRGDVAQTGALGRQIVGRDHRAAARCSTPRAHREPRSVQHADADFRRDQRNLCARPRRARRRRSAPMALANGVAKPSAIGSTSSTPRNRCANGALPRWTRRAPTLPRHCTNASRQSMSRPLLSKGSGPLCCCSAATRAGSPPSSRKYSPTTLPNGRLELFAGYGHGVNLLQPERCARAALDFWREVEASAK